MSWFSCRRTCRWLLAPLQVNWQSKGVEVWPQLLQLHQLALAPLPMGGRKRADAAMPVGVDRWAVGLQEQVEVADTGGESLVRLRLLLEEREADVAVPLVTGGCPLRAGTVHPRVAGGATEADETAGHHRVRGREVRRGDGTLVMTRQTDDYVWQISLVCIQLLCSSYARQTG